MSRIPRIVAPATFALLVLTLTATAHAQGEPSQVAYAGHSGFMIGFGLGISAATCNDCGDTETALGFDFNVGGFLNPRLALMYDASGWINSENGATLSLAANTLAAQYWVIPGVWLKGGLGFSQARIEINGDSGSELGVGATIGAGVEVLRQPRFAVDLSARINYLDFEGIAFQTFNFVAGARWK